MKLSLSVLALLGLASAATQRQVNEFSDPELVSAELGNEIEGVNENTSAPTSATIDEDLDNTRTSLQEFNLMSAEARYALYLNLFS